jgi:4-hydroxyphenylpyruvate dioxygenase
VSGVDHVALTQPWHRFDESALFFAAVLGMRPQESLDLPDPYGLFRSRAVTAPGSDLRIALNVAPGPDHDDERPQHIALAVPDLPAAVHALARAGIAMLPVPDNYYEDLDARFALPEQELSALRESGILYDRDAHGEFRHCYTATYGRVFLELVERRGDDQGFGAANAPVRLAAQRAAGPAGRS